MRLKIFILTGVLIEGEDVITIERNKENDRSLYLTANDDADGQEAYVKVRVMHLNEEGEAEEIALKGGSLYMKVKIDKRPYKKAAKR